MQVVEISNQLIKLLLDLCRTLESELSKNNKNIYCIYCLINFIKFYNQVIFEYNYIIPYSDKKFIENILQILELINKYNLINYSKKFKYKYANNERKGSILEIIFELLMNFFLNDDNNEECYNILLNKCKNIFYDQKFMTNEKCSVFYVNDILRYYMTKNNINLEEDIKIKIRDLTFYNELFGND